MIGATKPLYYCSNFILIYLFKGLNSAKGDTRMLITFFDKGVIGGKFGFKCCLGSKQLLTSSISSTLIKIGFSNKEKSALWI